MIAITLVVGFRVLGQEPIGHLTAGQEGYETTSPPTPPAVRPHLVLEPPKVPHHGRAREFESEVVTDGQDRSAEHHASAGLLPHEKVAKHFRWLAPSPRCQRCKQSDSCQRHRNNRQ